MRYPDFIEELIMAKSYAELSEAEKEQVAEWVSSEDEYNNIRQLLIGLNTAFIADEEQEAPTHIKASLQQAFAQKYAPKKRTTFSWRAVAIVSIAASVALLVYVGVLFTKENTTTPTAVNTEATTTEEAPTEKPILQEEEKENKNNPQDQSLPPPPSMEQTIERDLNSNAVIQSDDVAEYEAIEDIEPSQESAAPETEMFEQTFKNLEKKESNSAPAAPQRLNAPTDEGLKYKTITTNTVTVKDNSDLLDLSVTVY